MHVIHIDDKHNFRLSYNNHESLRISFNIELELRVGTNSLLFIRSDCIGGVGGVAVVLRAPVCSPPTAAPAAAAGVVAMDAAVPTVASIGIAAGTFVAGDASTCLPMLNNVGRVCAFVCGCDSCSKNCTKACSRLSLPGK